MYLKISQELLVNATANVLNTDCHRKCSLNDDDATSQYIPQGAIEKTIMDFMSCRKTRAEFWQNREIIDG